MAYRSSFAQQLNTARPALNALYQRALRDAASWPEHLPRYPDPSPIACLGLSSHRDAGAPHAWVHQAVCTPQQHVSNHQAVRTHHWSSTQLPAFLEAFGPLHADLEHRLPCLQGDQSRLSVMCMTPDLNLRIYVNGVTLHEGGYRTIGQFLQEAYGFSPATHHFDVTTVVATTSSICTTVQAANDQEAAAWVRLANPRNAILSVVPTPPPHKDAPL